MIALPLPPVASPPVVPSIHEILAAGIAGTPIPPAAVVQSGPFAGWRIVAPAGRPLGAPLLIDPAALCHARQRSEIPSSAAQAAGRAPAAASGRPSTTAEPGSACAAFLEPATGIPSAETPKAVE